MNDRYLFRGKREDNGEWVIGDLTQWNDGDMQIAVKDGDITKMQYIVIPETVGQCTGLKDKNGKLIFEGDICEFADYVGVVKFDDSDAMFTFIYDENIQMDFSCMWGKNLEIIGKIHDNPELLGVEE